MKRVGIHFDGEYTLGIFVYSVFNHWKDNSPLRVLIEHVLNLFFSFGGRYIHLYFSIGYFNFYRQVLIVTDIISFEQFEYKDIRN